MKRVLITAYAVDPYQGSEAGMGWNFILQAARFHDVIAVTRVNNGPAIRRFIAEHPHQQEISGRIEWHYYDWPAALRFWKKGPLLSLIYFYCWQLSVARWLKRKKLDFHLAHNLNFHNDWTPSFLWLLGKPVVWGPVGHHDAIPARFIRPIYGARAWMKDRLLWSIKLFCWHCDPFLRLAFRRAAHVFCMNTHAAAGLPSAVKSHSILPSVAAALPESPRPIVNTADSPHTFTVLSAGRFVPLKGFDLTIAAFAGFYHRRQPHEQKDLRLVIVGDGPQNARLHALVRQHNIASRTRFLDWVPRDEMHRHYCLADVFLFPSHEGAGMVVAEAMSHHLPVVCLDNSGPGQFLHPASRLKVPYSSYDQTIFDLATRLDNLYQQPRLLQKEKELAAQRFREFLHWDLRAQQLRHVYATVLRRQDNLVPLETLSPKYPA